MRFVPQTLDRVRVALLGRRIPAKHRRQAAPQVPQAPGERHYRPTPYVVGARLVDVPRLRRQRQAPVEEAWERTGAMVRPYVLAHEAERRTAYADAQSAPWAGPWANPWTDAQ